jgi:hypothetical protein
MCLKGTDSPTAGRKDIESMKYAKLLNTEPHKFPICLPGEECVPSYVKFEVFTAVTMQNAVMWQVMTCGSCKNRRFRGM